MNANTDKDYIDARMEGVDARLDSRFAQASGEFASFRADTDSGFAQVLVEFANFRADTDRRFAEVFMEFAKLRAEMAMNTASIVKWVAGTFIATITINIAGMAFVASSVGAGAAQKAALAVPAAAPAPVAIQLMPAPPGWTPGAALTPPLPGKK